jgi:uncharacterized protein (TIGR02246 family)
MQSSFRSTVTVFVLGLAACSTPAAPGFDQTDRDNINAVMKQFIAVYNAKDAQKVSMLFGETGAVMPPNASTVRGSENVREYYVKRFRQGASDLELDVGEVIGADMLAFVTGDYRLTMAPPDGTPQKDRGKFIFIFRERGDKWLFERLMFSSDFAPST